MDKEDEREPQCEGHYPTDLPEPEATCRYPQRRDFKCCGPTGWPCELWPCDDRPQPT